jgi:ArsR family transcriptional regulator, arsenate/arsenite/antimonite-responsive transcriptional repressor
VGLIKGNVEGNSICYCLDEEKVEQIFTYIQQIKTALALKNSCC